MGLESGTFIPELNETNPIGASDPKSQGDDHLRLIKRAILGSFPNFVGTTGVPKSITLTEDELNDAAQKAAAATIAGLWDFTTTPTIFTDEIGTKSIIQNQQNGNYTLLISDNGKHIYKASGGAGETFTIPANTSVAFRAGTAITFINDGGDDLLIAITTDTLVLEGDPSKTGTRTLANGGIATAIKVTATKWIIAGGNSLS